MKKRWLLTLSVYGLGVATVPGVLIGARWWQDAKSHAPKFVEIQHVSAEADASISIAQSEPDVFSDGNELPPPARSHVAEHKPSPKSIAQDDEFVQEPKSLQLEFDSLDEPPALAQNSPIRKPTEAKTSFDEFDAPAFRPSSEPGVVRGNPRSTPEVAKPELPDGIESLVEAELSDEQKAKLTTLREKLAELTKAKAELVNEQTLEETIFSLEKQISNLHAAQKLLSAQQILRALAEEFPDSPAAAKAQRMLEAAEGKKASRPPKPVPDSFDEEPVRTRT